MAKSKKAAPKTEVQSPSALHRRRTLLGKVVSDKMDKTIVVTVERRIRHKLYQKYVLTTKRFKAHDETNVAKTGDLVSIVSTRPISREKRWALQKVVRAASQIEQQLVEAGGEI